MIDYIALGLTHALIMLALLRVLVRPELDREDMMANEPDGDAEPETTPRARRRAQRRRNGGGHA